MSTTKDEQRLTADERLDRLEEALIELGVHSMSLLGAGVNGVPRVKFRALYAVEADVKARGTNEPASV